MHSVASYSPSEHSRMISERAKDPFSVIIELLKSLQNLLLLFDFRTYENDIANFMIDNNLVSKFCFINIQKKLLNKLSLQRIIDLHFEKDSPDSLKLLLLKVQGTNSLETLGSKNARTAGELMRSIAQKTEMSIESLHSESEDPLDDPKNNLLVCLGLIKIYLWHPKSSRQFVRIGSDLLTPHYIDIIKQFSEELGEEMQAIAPVESSPKMKSKQSAKTSQKIIQEPNEGPEPIEIEQPEEKMAPPTPSIKVRREMDSNLKKLLQMAEHKTLKKVLKEFYNRWVSISKDPSDQKKHEQIMQKTLNVVEIIVEMKKIDPEIMAQIFKIFEELLGSTKENEERYISELIFNMHAAINSELRHRLMPLAVNLPLKQRLLRDARYELASNETRKTLISTTMFLTEFLENARTSFHYVATRKAMLPILEALIDVVQHKLIKHPELIVRKNAVNLMVELSFFLDQTLFDPILARFTIEQQALIKIYITKKLSKQNQN